MNTIAYSTVNNYIMTILVDHNESNYNGLHNLVNPLNANYNTKNFKIIEIKSIKTNELVDKVQRTYFDTFYYVNTEYLNDSILYFLSYKKAFYYYFGYIRATTWFEKNKPIYFDQNISELYQEWFDNGILMCECYHINGNYEGPYKKYSIDGEMIIDAYYVNNEPLYYKHYKDGKIWDKLDGKFVLDKN